MKSILHSFSQLFFSMGILSLAACGGKGTLPDQHSTPTLDSLLSDSSLLSEEPGLHGNLPKDTLPYSGKPAKLTIKNDLDYAPEFLKELTNMGIAEQIELMDSLVILEKADSFIFPQFLPKAKWTNFVASKKGYLYSLDISSVNYTTVDFNFELRKGKQTIDQIKGKASISPGFLLGSESDDDPQTKTSYLVNEYHYAGADCSLNIRLGEDESIKKIKLIKTCKSGKYDIKLEECPILLEK